MLLYCHKHDATVDGSCGHCGKACTARAKK